jgi:hypothetical protein
MLLTQRIIKLSTEKLAGYPLLPNKWEYISFDNINSRYGLILVYNFFCRKIICRLLSDHKSTSPKEIKHQLYGNMEKIKIDIFSNCFCGIVKQPETITHKLW